VELPLALLSEAAVAEYIQRRFAGSQFPTTLAHMIHRATDGNPLFVVSLVEDLVRQGVVIASHRQWTLQDTFEAEELRVPEDLREMLAQQLERLTAVEQRLLEAASAAGVTFAAAAVAAGLDEDVVTIEEQCEGLARRQQFLRVAGMAEWPDGTVSGCYGFIHALYHNVVYQRLTAARRVRLHQRLGTCLEATYGARVWEIAAELAEHFGRGHVPRQAVQYLQQAAENAAQRSAPHEVIGLLTRALALLEQLPDTAERTPRALSMHVALLYGQDPGVACRSFDELVLWQLGYPERALATTSAALALAQDLAHPFSRVFALAFATWLEQLRGETQRIVELTATLQDLCAKHGFPQWLAAGLIWRGWALGHQGQATEGMVQMQQGLEAFRRTGARMLLPYFCGLLAQAYGAASQVDAGMGALAEGLTEVEKHGERFYEAELHRLKGEWLLQAQDHPLTATGAPMAPGCREAQRAVARHGLTRGGMALKWPHAIDRYREGSEADAASARHQAKPH